MAQPTSRLRTASWARYRPPQKQPGSLERRRVEAQIESVTRSHRVTVISAPSGFGKTTAVGAWASAGAPVVAWLSLGRFDNDLVQLTSGVIEALQSAARASGDPSLDPIAEIDSVTDGKGAYRIICAAFRSSARTVHLVVDDAQRGGDSLNAGLLGALIEGAPDALRIILVGTTFLEMTMSRLALTEPGAFITAADLAFDGAEVAALADAHATGLNADAVLAETQGWPIAVRLLLLGGVRPTDGSAVNGYDESLLHEYSRDHVLGSLPDSLAQFVLNTTVSRELTPELASALTDLPDAGEHLERCARLGLFLDRFDFGTKTLYRWHAVFARQCQAILESSDPERLHDLHRRAAGHLESDDPLASVSHSVKAGDPDAALQTLLRHWVALVVGSDAAAVAQVCSGFPGHLADDPRVLIVRACAHDVTGEQAIARTLFGRAVSSLDGAELDDTLVSLARLFLVDDRAAVADASAHVRAALEQPGLFEADDRAAVLYLLGWTELRHRTNAALVIELLTAAAHEAAARSEIALQRRALNHLAFAYAWAGQLRTAHDTLTALGEAEEEVASPWMFYAGGGGASAEGYIAYWGADLDHAFQAFDRVVQSGSSRTSFGGIARMMLAATAAAARDGRMCRHAAAELKSIPTHETQGVSWPAFRDTAAAVLEEAAGRRGRALAIAQRYADATNLPVVAVVLSGIMRRAGELGPALRLLQRHGAYLEASYLRVSLEATAALTHRRSGDTALAHERCEVALQIAVAEGVRLPFCDGDLEMRQLLADHLSHATQHADFIAECLTAPRERGVLSELSAKEHVVFRLLQTGRTVQEIANELALSINTIKTHQRAIYRKLGVSNRREAQRLVL